MFFSDSDFWGAVIVLLVVGAIAGIGCNKGCNWVVQHVDITIEP